MNKDIIANYYSYSQYDLIDILWVSRMEYPPNIINIKTNLKRTLVSNQRVRIDFKLLIDNLSKEHSVDIWNYESNNDKMFRVILCIDNTTTFYVSNNIPTEMRLLTLNEIYNIDANSLIQVLKDSCIEENSIIKPFYYLAVNAVSTRKQEINSNKKFCLEEQFNDDFLPISKRISSWLFNNNHNGLIILRGLKGTGKSSYIEYLITNYCFDIEFLFITKDLINNLLSDSLVRLIDLFQNKVVIFEDCEQFIKKRSNSESNNFISILLNLSDGLLASSCTTKFILTFNSQVSEIDDALLRKGRCVVNYEFKELSQIKTNNLLKKLGKNYVSNKGMTLTNIYNFEEESQEPVRKKIGF